MNGRNSAVDDPRYFEHYPDRIDAAEYALPECMGCGGAWQDRMEYFGGVPWHPECLQQEWHEAELERARALLEGVK